MSEIESPSTRQDALRLLIHGTTDQPQVLLPRTQTDPRSLFRAKDLSSIPPFHHIFPEVNNRPFARFAIREVNPLTPDPKNTESVTPEPSISLLQSGIMIVKDFNIAKPDGLARSMCRQLQRLRQFEWVLGLTDRKEKNPDDLVSSESIDPTQRLVSRLRKVTNSWFQNELSKDPLTQQAAKDLIQTRLPNVESAFAVTAESLRKHSFNLTDIHTEVERILHPKPERQSEPIVKPQHSKNNEGPDSESAKDNADRIAEEKAEIFNKLLSIAESEEISAKARKAGLTYTHDPIKDEPSETAAIFFRNLIEIPF